MGRVGKNPAAGVDDAAKAAKAAAKAAKAASAADAKKAKLKSSLEAIAAIRGAPGYDIGAAIAKQVKDHGAEAVSAAIKEYDAAKGGTHLGDLLPALEESPMTNVKGGAEGAVTSADTPPAAAAESAPAPAAETGAGAVAAEAAATPAEKPRRKRKSAAEKRAEAEAAAQAAAAAQAGNTGAGLTAANAGQPTPAQAAAATQAVQQGIVPGNSAANIRNMSQYVPPYQRNPQPQGYNVTQPSTYNPTQAAPQQTPSQAPAPIPVSDMIARMTAWQQSSGQMSPANQMISQISSWSRSQNNPVNVQATATPSSANSIRDMLAKRAMSAVDATGKMIGTNINRAAAVGIPAVILGTAAQYAAPYLARTYRDTMKGVKEGLAEPADPNAMSDEERLRKLGEILNGGFSGGQQ